MRYIILYTILCISIFSITKADTIDELKDKLSRARTSTFKLDIYMDLAEQMAEIGNKEAKMYADMALSLADSLKDEQRRAKALVLSATAWQIWGNNSKAIDHLFRALKYYKDNNFLAEHAETNRRIGEIYRASALLDKSLDYLKSAEHEFSKINDIKGLARTYNRFAAVYFEISYNNKEFRNMYDSMVNKMLNFAEIYTRTPSIKSSYDSTIKYIYISNNLARQSNDIQTEISTEIIHAALLNSFFKLDSSTIVYERLLNKIDKNGITIEKCLALNNLAGLYMNKKDYRKALEYALESYKLAVENEYKAYLYLSSGMVSLLYEKLGDLPAALEFTRITFSERVRYFNNDLDGIIRAVNYENEKINAQKDAEYSKRFNTVIVITFISILIIVSIFTLFLLRKNKAIASLNSSLISKNEIISLQNDELHDLNAEKDKFLSIIAHDLKNPISSFKMTTNMLTSYYDELSEQERRELILLLNESSENISSLLANLLEWSRSKRGKIVFSPVQSDLYSIVSMTIDLLSPLAEAKQISLVNTLSKDFQTVLDTNLITIVVRNLVSNAIKFTNEKGSITISAARREDDSTTISISDNGVGMNDEIKNKLFRIDESVSTLGTSGEKGTGLGLILCKEFVELHNGSINVESEVGKGTTFKITLPKISEN